MHFRYRGCTGPLVIVLPSTRTSLHRHGLGSDCWNDIIVRESAALELQNSVIHNWNIDCADNAYLLMLLVSRGYQLPLITITP